MIARHQIARPAPNPWGLWAAAASALGVLGLLAFWFWAKPHRTPVEPLGAVAYLGAASGPMAPPPALTQSGTKAGPVGGGASGIEARRTAAAEGRWARLTAAERTVLAPLEEDWVELTKDQRAKWFDLAQRFHSLQADEQQRVQARMAEWARMTPAERGAARLNFQELRQLSAKERLERWEAYQGLDADERKVLAERGQASATGATAARRGDPAAAVPKSSGLATEALAVQASTPPRSVGATVVQAPLGATTLLVSRLPSTPPPAGGPKISATSEFVDPATLLPSIRAARALPPPAAVEPVPSSEAPPLEPPSGPNETPPASGG